MSEITHWELRRGDEVLGRLVAHGWTYPWMRCEFEPTPLFGDYRDLFAGDFDLLEPGTDSPDYWDEWEAAFNRIVRAGIAFVPADEAARQLRADLVAREGDRAAWLEPILGL